jgi:hypothetical protein
MSANTTVFEGTAVRFYTATTSYANAPVGAFTDYAGNPVDPDIVTFGYVLPNIPSVTYTYTAPTGDPTGNIVRTGVGEYYCDLDTTGLVGNIIWRWAGKPNVLDNIDTTETMVATEGAIVVLANDLLN